ncbi:hypothetical protein, conserved [Babesia bigemina]|uniref:Uncharacterized protein n=1 Tax=Babesia bigemina TaxID=5866 RepID=A0A061D9M7_BABBI|nr:hypothetical protein, conserved [Babesia bigemina]CDR94430.1 hypothetical protein, conserved [Babesia bigemina]|eukprot:XP_012766616.1 hypothetical protein, conserved [Babesia bigemina]
MGIAIRWQELRWRSSLRSITNLLKYHTALVLSVILAKLCVTYASKAFYSSVYTESGLLAIYRPCAAALSSYLALLAMFMARQASFRASTKTGVYTEVLGLLNVVITILCIAVIANVVFRVYISGLYLVTVVCVAVLYQLRVRRQRLDVMRSLDKECIAAPHIRTFVTLSIFHVAASYAVAVVIGIVARVCATVWEYAHLAPTPDWNISGVLDTAMTVFPGIRAYTGNFYGVECVCILSAATWTIALTDAFYEYLNRQLSHMVGCASCAHRGAPARRRPQFM